MDSVFKEAGTAYPSGPPEFTSAFFGGVRVFHSLIYIYMSCSFLFVISRWPCLSYFPFRQDLRFSIAFSYIYCTLSYRTRKSYLGVNLLAKTVRLTILLFSSIHAQELSFLQCWGICPVTRIITINKINILIIPIVMCKTLSIISHLGCVGQIQTCL